MTRKYLALAILMMSTALISLSGCTQPERQSVQPFSRFTSDTHQISRLAVIAVPQRGFLSTEAENLAMQAVSRKGYLIVSRSDLQEVLRERHIQQSAFMDRATAVTMRKLLNVDGLLVLQAKKIEMGRMQHGGQYLMSMTLVGRLIDTEHGDVIWIRKVELKPKGLAGLLRSLPEQILVGGHSDPVPRLISRMMAHFPAAQNRAVAAHGPAQSRARALAGAPVSGATVAPMSDPRLQLTSQDLLYAATALRAQAVRSAEDAARPEYGSTREVFARSAASQRKLAEKFQRIGEELGPRAEK